MNRAFAVLTSVTALVLAAASPMAFAADVGVSVQISQPGVYGRVDIGRFPQPAVVVQQPVIVQRTVVVRGPAPVAVVQPVYLWVPPGHRKNWRKHCAHYGACGTPVYFVRDDWYRERGPGRDWHPKAHDRDHGHDRDRDDRGHGKGRGHH